MKKIDRVMAGSIVFACSVMGWGMSFDMVHDCGVRWSSETLAIVFAIGSFIYTCRNIEGP